MSLEATKMNALIAQHSNGFDGNMVRAQEYGALDLFARGTLLNDNIRQLALGSMGNDVKIPVFKNDGEVTVSSSRSCTIAANENTSALYTVNWATLAVQFTVTPVLEMNNYMKTADDMWHKMEKVSIALANAMDQLAVSALASAKTSVFKDSLMYETTGNAIQSLYEGRMDVLADMDSMMRANGYRGRMHMVGNAGIDATYRKLSEHGLYNDVNKTIEYAGKPLHFTNNIVNGTGKFGTGYMVEEGSVGVLTRVDREAFRGSVGKNGHEWGIINLPHCMLPVGFHYYQDAGSQASIAGDASADMTCVLTDHYEFSVDVAFITAYNSDPDTIANPIMKVEIWRSGYSNPYAIPVWIAGSGSGSYPEPSSGSGSGSYPEPSSGSGSGSTSI